MLENPLTFIPQKDNRARSCPAVIQGQPRNLYFLPLYGANKSFKHAREPKCSSVRNYTFCFLKYPSKRDMKGFIHGWKQQLQLFA